MKRVDISDLSVSFGDVSVLTGLSGCVSPGRFVGLVGPNGAGKTTLLRAVSGALTPDAGRVEVDGESIHDRSSRAASRLVATVPQEPRLDFSFTVRQVVEMGRTPWVGRFERFDGDDRDAVDRAMERASVAEFADRPVTAVSGGERQRVLLARALAQETPVLLLDEPTASLDVNHATRTLELARRLADEGKTVVAAIHDLDMAARYCDELFFLSNGHLVATGAPTAVLTSERLREAFDADAVVSRNPVTDAPQVTTLPERGDAEGRVHVLAGGGRVGPVLSQLAAAGYEVTVGAVPAGDADCEVAHSLGLETVETTAFGRIDAETREEVRRLVRAADATVVPRIPLTAGMRPNLAAASEAGRLVVFERRDDADGTRNPDALSQFERLHSRGRVVPPGELLTALEAALSETESTPRRERSTTPNR